MTKQECLDILNLLDCGRSEGNIEECKDMLRAALEETELQIDTPKGIVKAVKSPDKENPGIVLLFLDRNGREHSACTMQYLKDQDRTVANIYSSDNPDGDPVFTFGMD